MKNCIFLLILSLHTNSTLFREKTRDILNTPKTIPQRNLTGDDEIHEYLKKALVIITENQSETKMNFEDIAAQESPEEFTITFEGKEGCEIDGKADKIMKSISIKFKTPLDESNLTLTNIDPDSEKQNIIDRYIKPFLDHVDEIFSGPDKVIEAIKALEGADLGVREGVTSEIGDGEDGDIVVTLTEGNVKELYKISVSEEGGDLNVKIKNIFFETNFDLTIPTESFLQTQLKEMFANVQVHYERIKRLSSNGETLKAEKEINCESIQTLLSDDSNNTYKDQKFEIQGDKISFDGKDFEYSCKENEEDKYIILKVTKDSIVMVQPLLSMSLYDLDPAIESFYDDVKETMYKALVEKSNDEFSVYKSAGGEE